MIKSICENIRPTNQIKSNQSNVVVVCPIKNTKQQNFSIFHQNYDDDHHHRHKENPDRHLNFRNLLFSYFYENYMIIATTNWITHLPIVEKYLEKFSHKSTTTATTKTQYYYYCVCATHIYLFIYFYFFTFRIMIIIMIIVHELFFFVFTNNNQTGFND